MNRLKKLLCTLLALTVVTSAVFFSASAATIATGAGKVSCDALNVRAKADTSGTVLRTLRQGDTVVILDKPGADWYHVSAYGTVGYVSAQYISEVESAKNFTATGKLTGSDIRLRSTPSTSGDVLGTYSAGTTMSVIGINSGWYKVKYDGKTGYIRSDFMELTGGPAAGSGTSGSSAAPVAAAQSEGQKIANYAKQFNGYRYVYGAESPDDGFDCSGLMYYVYGHFGYSISRTATQQYLNNGRVVTQSELQPGDLVFFQYEGSICHVGMYIGDRNFIHACDSSTGVIISSLDSHWGTTAWYGAKRLVG